MKSFLLVLFTLASTQAFAANVCDQSWDQINSNYSLVAAFPKIQFAPTFTFVSVDGVCVDGNTLYTSKPVLLCMGSTNSDHGQCANWVAKTLSTPLTYSHDISVGEGNQFTTITETHALNYKISITRANSGNSPMVICKKAYTIPQCHFSAEQYN